jgi:hypothetical protein
VKTGGQQGAPDAFAGVLWLGKQDVFAHAEFADALSPSLSRRARGTRSRFASFIDIVLATPKRLMR